jgi:AraC-like DNA-binding protein
MYSDLQAIIKHLSRLVYEIPLQEVHMGYRSPAKPPDVRVQSQPWHRMIIPLSGLKHILIADGEHISRLNLTPGQLLYLPPFAWSLPEWTSVHEMLAVVFRGDFLRIAYIDYYSLEKPRPLQDHIFHLAGGGSPQTNYTLQALTEATQSPLENGYYVKLLDCLLRFVLDDVSQCKSVNYSKSYSNWLKLSDYVRMNFQNQVSRCDLAEMFGLTPEYVSRLFQKYAGKSFSGFLADQRIDHAVVLLKESSMDMKEIAWDSGYSYPSHFIRMFRRRFNMTPGQFRCRTKEHERRASPIARR